MLASAEQQSESAMWIHTSPPSWASLQLTRLSHHSTKLSVLCCLAGPTSYLVHTRQCVYPRSSHPPFPANAHMFLLYACVSVPALRIGSSVPFPPQIPHICVNIRYLSFCTEVYSHRDYCTHEAYPYTLRTRTFLAVGFLGQRTCAFGMLL